MTDSLFRGLRRGAYRRTAMRGKVSRVPSEFMVDEDLTFIPGEDEIEFRDDLTTLERQRKMQERYYGKKS